MMFAAGVDGCRVGWVCVRVELLSRETSVEVIDLCGQLRQRPERLAAMAIDIPIGLLDGPRACDLAARKLLRQPRGSSVFPPPCRAAIESETYTDACKANHFQTGRNISRQAWGIAKKIKEVDGAMIADRQTWAFEVHPEVCFWAMNGASPMRNGKKNAAGRAERLSLLRRVFPGIDCHVSQRPRESVSMTFSTPEPLLGA
jgi:predicted RNase H-like nuclease